MTDSFGSGRGDRRGFLKALGAAGVGSVMLGGAWSAAGEAAPGSSGSASPPRGHAAADSTNAATSKPRADDVRALAEVVKARFGAHLTAEQLEAVTVEIEQRVEGGRKLRESKLRNADEPDTTFGA